MTTTMMTEWKKLLGDKLASKHGPVDMSTLQDHEVIAIQFPALWFGQCTPNLTKIYHELRGAGKTFPAIASYQTCSRSTVFSNWSFAQRGKGELIT